MLHLKNEHYIVLHSGKAASLALCAFPTNSILNSRRVAQLQYNFLSSEDSPWRAICEGGGGGGACAPVVDTGFRPDPPLQAMIPLGSCQCMLDCMAVAHAGSGIEAPHGVDMRNERPRYVVSGISTFCLGRQVCTRIVPRLVLSTNAHNK